MQLTPASVALVRGAAVQQVHRAETHEIAPGAGSGMNSPPTILPAGRVLFWQGDDQRQQIEICKGLVRAVRLFGNGRRQILAFYWPGDIIRAIRGSSYSYTAETVSQCELRWCSEVHLACGPTNRSGADQILGQVLPLLTAIAQKSTVARLAWFLLRVRNHLPPDPRIEGVLRIVFPRADIADYLGMSVETVCRTLSDFKTRHLIDLPTRKTLRIRDVSRLRKIAQGWSAF